MRILSEDVFAWVVYSYMTAMYTHLSSLCCFRWSWRSCRENPRHTHVLWDSSWSSSTGDSRRACWVSYASMSAWFAVDMRRLLPSSLSRIVCVKSASWVLLTSLCQLYAPKKQIENYWSCETLLPTSASEGERTSKLWHHQSRLEQPATNALELCMLM